MIKIKLTIAIPYNFDAEDVLSNALQDEGIASDLLVMPIHHELWEYLVKDYGHQLGIEVKVTSVT